LPKNIKKHIINLKFQAHFKFARNLKQRMRNTSVYRKYIIYYHSGVR